MPNLLAGYEKRFDIRSRVDLVHDDAIHRCRCVVGRQEKALIVVKSGLQSLRLT